jgi:hypothetical protein
MVEMVKPAARSSRMRRWITGGSTLSSCDME